MHDLVIEKPNLADLLKATKTEQTLRLAQINAELEKKTAQERVIWAAENLEGEQVVSSSFGV